MSVFNKYQVAGLSYHGIFNFIDHTGAAAVLSIALACCGRQECGVGCPSSSYRFSVASENADSGIVMVDRELFF